MTKPARMPLQSRILPLFLFLVVGLTSLRAQVPDVIGIYLTWLRDPDSTMVVNWVDLHREGPARVWVREAGGDEWRSVDGTHSADTPSVLQVRRVEIEGLRGDTVYEFALGEAAPTSPRGIERFRTPPKELSRPVRFISGGDTMHRRDWFDAMNRAAGARDPDFAVIGGDLAYANDVSASRWVEWLQSVHQTLRTPDGRLVPLVVGIGNHEVKGYYNGRVPQDAAYFYGLFAFPHAGKSTYALDFGNYLSFVMLDTDHTQRVEGAQTEWLATTLAERDGQRFVFPVYHYPAYGTTKGPKDGLPSDHPLAQKIRREWSPLFEKHAVTAVFENDHHAYKRTHPIREGRRDDASGVVYLGDGAWGVGTRPVVTPEQAWYLARSEARRHVFVVTLDPAGTAQVEAIDAKGEVFDRTTLTGRPAAR
jgi:Phosphodiesterase/alkaline phosphatase D